MVMPRDLEETLEARGKEYGDYQEMAGHIQQWKERVRYMPGFQEANHGQREAIDMIIVKLVRLCNGNTYNLDSWNDIAGYAELGAKSSMSQVVPNGN